MTVDEDCDLSKLTGGIQLVKSFTTQKKRGPAVP